ncbi:tRNA(Ile)-lysidine synthase [Bombiscardovia apis]|uniref:tRNA(Ile)-lysidine synthase n=1 Tax=Bombiscardovia apis TaxID=2932182 RepID=A0ABM8BDQ2_9BIFI|nr:tRNA(Ile)-lysidine synthase [Bombiscardovia apis]
MRTALTQANLGLQDPQFREHGAHTPQPDAPLVLVACSGGRDSIALAALASIVCPTLGLRCGALVVDHGLLENSERITAQALESCSQLGLAPLASQRIAVTRTRAGLEADARQARYKVFIEQAQELKASAVLLAHTADDQAEGVLIGLIRSSGLGAVAGMESQVEREGVCFLRPILDVSRSETTQICQQLNLCWWDDPTNGDDIASGQELPSSYPLRSRVRHDLLPALSEFADKDMTAQLAQTAQLTRGALDYLNEEALKLLAKARLEPSQTQLEMGAVACLRVEQLADAHPALRSQLWVCLCNQFGIAPVSRQIAQLDALVSSWHGQAALALPSNYSAVRKHHVILLCKDRNYAHRRY